jgi:hypothetical protein
MLLILLILAGHGQLLRKEELLFRVPGLLPPFFFVWRALLPLLCCFAAKFAGALRREKNDHPALMAYPSEFSVQSSAAMVDLALSVAMFRAGVCATSDVRRN